MMNYDRICELLATLSHQNQVRYSVAEDGGLGNLYVTLHGHNVLSAPGVNSESVEDKLDAEASYKHGRYLYEIDPRALITDGYEDQDDDKKEDYLATRTAQLVGSLGGASPLQSLSDVVKELIDGGELCSVKGNQGNILTLHATPDAAIALRNASVVVPQNARVGTIAEALIRRFKFSLGTHSQPIEMANILAKVPEAKQAEMTTLLETAPPPPVLTRRDEQQPPSRYHF